MEVRYLFMEVTGKRVSTYIQRISIVDRFLLRNYMGPNAILSLNLCAVGLFSTSWSGLRGRDLPGGGTLVVRLF